jgi:hypothetical protein
MLAYSTASFAPSGSSVSGCSGAYEAISYWATSCEQIATTEFAQLKTTGMINRAIKVLDGGPTMRVFLMPAGQGCIAIKKEVIFN